MSISMFLMPGISQKLQFFTWPQQMTLTIKVIITYFDPLFIMGWIGDTDSILVSIWTYPILGISKWLTYVSIVDLENQGQTYFQMTFIISGWIHATEIILVLIFT